MIWCGSGIKHHETPIPCTTDISVPKQDRPVLCFKGSPLDRESYANPLRTFVNFGGFYDGPLRPLFSKPRFSSD